MKTLLLIDDDLVVRKMISGILMASGWEVLEAEDGETGLSLALANKPKVIICDLFMPRCNGFQLCRTVRADLNRYGRPLLIVTTGSGYETDRRSALEAGADEVFTKPVDIDALLDSLDKFCAAEAAQTSFLAAAPPAVGPQPSLVRFWGVRGSIAVPGPSTVRYGGNTACVEVRSGGQIIVLDAGTGIRPLGLALMKEFQDRPIRLTILVSHTHWDHIQGFPFFYPAYNPANRIRVLGYEGPRKGLEMNLAAQMESPYFPVGLEQMPGHIVVEEIRDVSFPLGPVQVQTAFLNHPGTCTGYRLLTDGGAICYLPDVEPPRHLAAQKCAKDAAAQLEFARGREEKLVEFVRGAEVLIVDCQYDAEEYQRHIGWGHSSVVDSLDLALRAEAKRLFLFHHDPNHDDDKIARMVEEAKAIVAERGGRLVVEAAREGLEVVLEPMAVSA
jgi:phosphoribosyl 1,2-cyclic phosphodiesterase/CheY-like chemotaxis protein